jgi:hypothetical protein
VNFNNFTHNSHARRNVGIAIYVALLACAFSATVAGVIFLYGDKKVDINTRLVGIGDLAAGSTVILAVIAGLVALQAYAAATGLPSLKLQVWFNYSEKNEPVFQARTESDEIWTTTDLPPGQTTAMIFLQNTSSFSARNPAVILKLKSVRADAKSFDGRSWSFFELPSRVVDAEEAQVFQWDGGADFSIHGHSVRRLPDLNLGSVSYSPKWRTPRMTIEVVADGGFRRNIVMSISFIHDNEYISSPSKVKGADEWL